MPRNIEPRNEETRKEYLNWLMTPGSEREPATKKDFASFYGVARSTLYDWENSEDFQNQLRTLKSKWGVRWHGDILNRLMQIVLEGTDASSINASKVLLGHIQVEAPGEKKDELSADEFAELKKALEAAGWNVRE